MKKKRSDELHQEAELSVCILGQQGSWIITEVWGRRLAIAAFVPDSGTPFLAGMVTELVFPSCCPLFRLDIPHADMSSPVVRNRP